MVARESSLSSDISWRMLSLGHGAYRQRLDMRCERTGTIVFYVNESFASKICGGCSFYHANLGANKIFHCPQCRTTESRDGGASRKVLLKAVISVALEALATGISDEGLYQLSLAMVRLASRRAVSGARLLRCLAWLLLRTLRTCSTPSTSRLDRTAGWCRS
jgi:hypothetical protein